MLRKPVSIRRCSNLVRVSSNLFRSFGTPEARSAPSNRRTVGTVASLSAICANPVGLKKAVAIRTWPGAPEVSSASGPAPTSNTSPNARANVFPSRLSMKAGFRGHGEAPRTNRARSRRSMSKGLRHLTPRPMQTLGILILFRDGEGISWVTTA